MAFPQIMGTVVQGTVTSDDSTWDMTYPDDIVDGELILALGGLDGDVNISSAPDWIADADLGSFFAKRIGTPSLSGTGFTITFTGAEQGCWKVIRISGWEGTLGTNFNNSDSSGGACPAAGFNDATEDTPNTGGMTPFNWDASAEDTLWLGMASVDGPASFSANPSGYTLVGTNQTSGGADGRAFSVAAGEIDTVTEFVPPWTIDTTRLYRCWMHAIRPGTSGNPQPERSLRVNRSPMRW